MSGEQIRQGTQNVWNNFYSLRASWERSDMLKAFRNRVAFVIASKVMLQAFGNTGLSTDSARASRATKLGGNRLLSSAENVRCRADAKSAGTGATAVFHGGIVKLTGGE